MPETFYVIPESQHNDLVSAAYVHRGYGVDEGNAAAKFAAYASHHGIRTHNALKALPVSYTHLTLPTIYSV